MTEIRPVKEREAIAKVAALARLVWEPHYTPLIGPAQTAYMLERFQSEAAIEAQLAQGYDYFLLVHEGGEAGYFAVLPDPAGASALLSKIYVLPERQGQELGRWMIAWIEAYCRCRRLGTLWLTVNRHNRGSIAFYERVGFVNTGALVQEIGQGFVMDDFKMVKTLAPADGSPPVDPEGDDDQGGWSGVPNCCNL
jgi:GNAT superfamily N-acetyltransferase